MDFENVRTVFDIEIAIQFMIFITFETRDKTCSKIKKVWFLLVQWVAKGGMMNGKMIIILIYLSNNSPQAERNFSGQTLDFLQKTRSSRDIFT